MNSRLSFRQLKEEVDRFATAMAALGVGKGTRVAIQLPNLPQTVIAYYATLSLGGQAVMTNPLYVEREIEHQWNDAGCSLAVTADFLFEGASGPFAAGCRSRTTSSRRSRNTCASRSTCSRRSSSGERTRR